MNLPTPKKKPTPRKARRKAKQRIGTNQEKWLRALESGRYEQCKSVLFDGTGHCCLGVACRTQGLRPKTPEETDHTYEFEGQDSELPESVREALQFHRTDGCRKDSFTGSKWNLMALNDEQDANFLQIAALVRAEPHQYFRRPA